MRDLVADWRRWTKAERIIGPVVLGLATTVTAMTCFLAA
jgi:hypothetical protein